MRDSPDRVEEGRTRARDFGQIHLLSTSVKSRPHHRQLRLLCAQKHLSEVKSSSERSLYRSSKSDSSISQRYRGAVKRSLCRDTC